MINEWVMAAGDWQLRLSPDIPQTVLGQLDAWDHVVITDQWVDPARFSDSQLKALARWSGVLLELPRYDSYEIGGLGLALHLGDPDGIGDLFETAVTYTAETFPNWIRALLPAGGSIVEGVLSSASGALTATLQWVTPRQAIDWVCGQFSQPAGAEDCEWRVNPDGSLDAGVQSDLYITAPAIEVVPCLLVADETGTQPNAKAVPVNDLSGQDDARLRLMKQWVHGQGEGETLITGSAVQSAHGLKDFHGNTLIRTKVTADSRVSAANISQRAERLLRRSNYTHRRWEANLADFHMQGQFDLGDWVLVYDQQADFTDTANQMDWRGDRIAPKAVRVVGWQWAVTDGMGVYVRGKTGVWTDLTEHVMFESPGTVLFLGDRPVESLTVDLQGEMLAGKYTSDDAKPEKPTDLAATADTYLNSRGLERAYAVPTWTNPTLNTDGSTLTDLDQVRIRYRRNSTSEEWAIRTFGSDESGTAQIPQLDPDTVYELQAQARRVNGKASNWTDSATVDTAHDTIPPNTPESPEVEGVGTAGIHVAHTLHDDEAANLDADTVSLRVYVDTATPVTCDQDTHAGNIPVTYELINSGDRVVRRFDQVGTGASRTNLIRGVTYYVAVKAVDETGNLSDPSTSTSGVVAGDPTGPAVPADLAAEVYLIEGKYGSLRVYWTANTETDLHHYVLRYRRKNSGDEWTRLPRVGSDETETNVDNLLTGKTYQFQIRAVDAHTNRSVWSSTAETAAEWGLTGPDVPPKPTMIAVPGGFNVSFNLATWGPANPEAKKIKVFIGPAAGPTTARGRIWLDYDDDLANGDVVTYEWRPGVIDASTRWWARGKAYDWAGNPSQA